MAKVSDMYKLTLFCPSLVRSEPTWPHPEELRFETKKYWFCVNIKEAKCSQHMEILAQFQHFRANLRLRFGAPLRKEASTIVHCVLQLTIYAVLCSYVFNLSKETTL